MPYRVPITALDQWIAATIAEQTKEPAEAFSKAMTWGGDEHVICAAAALFWFYSRLTDRHRSAADHFVAVSAASAAIPHALKKVINQRRPDRLTLRGHLHGIPFSGNADDAFPSGHAVHIGALMSAASRLPSSPRNLVWAIGAGIMTTRIVLLAHWASDVAAGTVLGVAIERSVRILTNYKPKEQSHG